MLFDKLCGVVERPDELRPGRPGLVIPHSITAFLRDLRRVVTAANLFVIPDGFNEGEIHTKVLAEKGSLLGDEFFLPFQAVAVEYPDRLTLLGDIDPKAVGLAPHRFFVHAWPADGNELMARAGLPASVRDEAVFLAWGQMHDIRYIDDLTRRRREENLLGVGCQFVSGGTMVATKRQILGFEEREERVVGVLRRILHEPLLAFETVAYLNLPSRFVVETRSGGYRDDERPDRIRRSHERAKFTTLTPGEIKKLFGRETGEDRQSPTPHERRRHTRTFRSERYAKSGLLGKSIIIPATWVGETEAVVGNKKYIVRTDL